MSQIPTPEDVTPAWLTEQLQKNNIAAEVESFTSKRIGTGQIGMCFRYELTYKSASETAPPSLVGKFPSDDEASRSTGVQLRNFIKEVKFYQELQDQLTIATPKCYYADIVGEGPEFMLLLEDLAPGEQGDQLKGCDASTAEAAILQLVGLHGPSWNKQELVGIDWLGSPDPEAANMVSGLYQMVLPGFLDRYGGALNDDQKAIISAFGTSEKIKQTELSTPFSLVHIDYRLDNLLLKRTSSGIQATAVDWQSITLGNPMTDVAYFIGAGILRDERRAQEQSIVEKYHQALLAAGIQDYDFDGCWRDYRRATFAGFSVTVIASMMVQQTERGDQMFTAMADRHSQHALDLSAGDFL